MFMLLLMLSPLPTITILGAFYITFIVIVGSEFSVAVSSFKTIIYNLKPYFTYLTLIPVALLILVQPFKNKIKIHILRK